MIFHVSGSSCARDKPIEITKKIFEKHRMNRLNLIIVFKTKNPTKVRFFVYSVIYNSNCYLSRTIFFICLKLVVSMVYIYIPAATGSPSSLVASHETDLYPALSILLTKDFTFLPITS